MKKLHPRVQEMFWCTILMLVAEMVLIFTTVACFKMVITGDDADMFKYLVMLPLGPLLGVIILVTVLKQLAQEVKKRNNPPSG